MGFLGPSSHPPYSETVSQSPTTVSKYPCIHLLWNYSWSVWTLEDETKLQTSMAQHPRRAKISNTETAWIN